MKKPISTPGSVRRVGNDPLKPTLAAGVPGVVFHTDRPLFNAFTDWEDCAGFMRRKCSPMLRGRSWGEPSVA